MYYVLQSLGVEKCYSLSIPVIGFYFLHFLWIFMKNTNAYQLTTIDKIFFIYILPPPPFFLKKLTTLQELIMKKNLHP